MRVVGELWCVICCQSDSDAYTALFSDRDSAREWVMVHMTETFADCGDDDENKKFLALKTVGEKMEHCAELFGTSYELVLRDIQSRDTPITQLAEAVDEVHGSDGDQEV